VDSVLVQSFALKALGPRGFRASALKWTVASGQWTVRFRVALPRGFGTAEAVGPLARALALAREGEGGVMGIILLYNKMK
jgi:hypothetical protein